MFIPPPPLTNHHGQCRHLKCPHAETPQDQQIKNLHKDVEGINLTKQNSEVPATVTSFTPSTVYFKEFINPNQS